MCKNHYKYEICVFDAMDSEADCIDGTFTDFESARIEATKLFESGEYFGVEVISLNQFDDDPIKYILTK